MQLPIDHHAMQKRLNAGCLVFFVLILTASPAFSGDAELINLIVRNKNDQLQVDLLIRGVFTEEMKAALSKGIPINLTFFIYFSMKFATIGLMIRWSAKQPCRMLNVMC